MSTTKVVDSMRDVTVVDAAKITTGAVPAAALTNVDLVEGTKGVDIASAGTMVIGTDGGYFDITGTTGITAMTVAAGRVFTLQFDGVVTLTHSSTLYLSGAANFTTEANDHMTFISVAANDVRQIGTGLKDGGSPVASVHTGSVAFPATAVLSADANTLDDYEEGTWTPTIWDTSESNSESQTYNSQYGTYTKIGNIVCIASYFNLSSNGSLTDAQNATVGGVPFTSASTGYHGMAILHGYYQVASGTSPGWYISNNGSKFHGFLADSSNGHSGLLISEVGTLGQVGFSGYYRVTV